jgi:hypothetical protein
MMEDRAHFNASQVRPAGRTVSRQRLLPPAWRRPLFLAAGCTVRRASLARWCATQRGLPGRAEQGPALPVLLAGHSLNRYSFDFWDCPH